MGPDTPRPADAILELVAAGVEDLREDRAMVDRNVAEAERRLAEVDEAAGKRAELEARISELEAEAEAERQRANNMEGQRNTLRELVAQLESVRGKVRADAGKTNGETKPRREKVEGHTGVYERPSPDGRPVYEIGWTEDGRQRWQTIGPDLNEAIETRERLTAVAA